MPLYLIRITRRNWDRTAHTSWLGANQVPADVYRDLRVTNGALSAWHIEDDRSNLLQVITALAATRDVIDVFDYGLFDQSFAANSGVKAVPSLGISPMPSANQWHRDFVELTVDTLTGLIKVIFDVMEKRRISRHDIRTLIVSAAEAGHLELSDVKPSLRQQILGG